MVSLLTVLKESGYIPVLAGVILLKIEQLIVIVRNGVERYIYPLVGISSGMHQVLMVMITRKLYLSFTAFSNDVGADITIYYSDSLAA